jgi:hypothetical protein
VQEVSDPSAGATLVKLERQASAAAAVCYPGSQRTPHYTDLQAAKPAASGAAPAAFPLAAGPLQQQGKVREGEESSRHERDKKNIYKHPLFPLLALLFEKERRFLLLYIARFTIEKRAAAHTLKLAFSFWIYAHAQGFFTMPRKMAIHYHRIKK